MGISRTALLLASTASAVLLACGVVLVGAEAPAQAAFQSKSNGKIAVAFFPVGATGGSDIFTVAPDGTKLVNITKNSADDHTPQWSPDGTKIAFASNRGGAYDIYVAEANGSNAKNLTEDANVQDVSPDWTPDGKIIYDTVNPSSGTVGGTWIREADGSNPVQVTGPRPLWSPDGAKIAFYRTVEGHNDLYVSDVDGGNEINLSNDPATTSDDDLYENSTDWSPDSRKLLFTQGADTYNGQPRIYMVNAAGSGLAPLTTGTSDAGVWSPDGTKIAYVIYRSDFVAAGSLVVRDLANGSEKTLHTDPTVSDQTDGDLLLNGVPDWQPNTPPVVTLLRPSPGATTTDRTPRIQARVTDSQTDLAKGSILLALDDRPVPRRDFDYDRSTNRLSYIPSSALAYGRHRVQIAAKDEVRLVTTKQWSFRVVR